MALKKVKSERRTPAVVDMEKTISHCFEDMDEAKRQHFIQKAAFIRVLYEAEETRRRDLKRGPTAAQLLEVSRSISKLTQPFLC